jgi:hypothetical protein
MGDIYDTGVIVSSAGRRLQGAVIERATGTDYHVNLNSKAFPIGDLYATAEDGTNLRRLTETSTTESTPTWSRDGSSVAFELSFWAPTADR